MARSGYGSGVRTEIDENSVDLDSFAVCHRINCDRRIDLDSHAKALACDQSRTPHTRANSTLADPALRLPTKQAKMLESICSVIRLSLLKGESQLDWSRAFHRTRCRCHQDRWRSRPPRNRRSFGEADHRHAPGARRRSDAGRRRRTLSRASKHLHGLWECNSEHRGAVG